jgi:hypothetical protein
MQHTSSWREKRSSHIAKEKLRQQLSPKHTYLPEYDKVSQIKLKFPIRATGKINIIAGKIIYKVVSKIFEIDAVKS